MLEGGLPVLHRVCVARALFLARRLGAVAVIEQTIPTFGLGLSATTDSSRQIHRVGIHLHWVHVGK